MKLNSISKLTRRIIYHTVNGVRSGIPICCVMFFNKHIVLDTKQIAYTVDTNRGIEFGKCTIQYVQCNRCFNKGKVKNIKTNGVILKSLIK